jgi:DNA processing protein
MNQTETLCAMALARLLHFQPAVLTELYRHLGSATAIVENRNRINEVVPEASPKLREVLADFDTALKRAEEELVFCGKHGIRVLVMGNADYPARLAECADAPLVLYYRGTADLNCQKIIFVVGTRHCTTYGQDLVRRFVTDLRMLCPNVLIVSGLAYGIDINAHRQALQNGMLTVGVLAHGLDDLYPPRHRQTAIDMLSQGGLVTEFMSKTQADKVNFVRRNRIVAGMSDACVVVESAARGGALITAEIARSYSREVFAFPGRVGDEFSEGCNHLIRDTGAQLLTSAEDLVLAMGWQNDAQLRQAQAMGIERQLFPALSPDEQAVVKALAAENDQQLNVLARNVGVSVAQLSTTLFSLEMKGLIKTLAGGVQHLLK